MNVNSHQQTENSLIERLDEFHDSTKIPDLFLTAQLNMVTFSNKRKEKKLKELEKELDLGQRIECSRHKHKSLSTVQEFYIEEEVSEFWRAAEQEKSRIKSRILEERKVSEQLKSKKANLTQTCLFLKKNINFFKDITEKLESTHQQGSHIRTKSTFELQLTLDQLNIEKKKYTKMNCVRTVKLNKLRAKENFLKVTVNQLSNRINTLRREKSERSEKMKSMRQKIKQLDSSYKHVKEQKDKNNKMIEDYEKAFEMLTALVNNSKLLSSEEKIQGKPQEILTCLKKIIEVDRSLHIKYLNLENVSEKLKVQLKAHEGELRSLKSLVSEDEQALEILQKVGKLHKNPCMTYNQLDTVLQSTHREDIDKREEVIVWCFSQVSKIREGMAQVPGLSQTASKRDSPKLRSYKSQVLVRNKSVLDRSEMNFSFYDAEKLPRDTNNTKDIFIHHFSKEQAKIICDYISRNYILRYYSSQISDRLDLFTNQNEMLVFLFSASHEKLCQKFKDILQAVMNIAQAAANGDYTHDNDNSNLSSSQYNKGMPRFRILEKRSFFSRSLSDRHKERDRRLPEIKNNRDLLKEIKSINFSLTRLRRIKT